MFRNVLPPTCLAMAIILIFILHFSFPAAEVTGMSWKLAGMLPVLLGVVLNPSADSSLRRHGTTVKPFRESSALVTEGVFRLSRHPMYLGFIIILGGISVLLGSLTPFLLVIAFAVFLGLVFIREEERMLEEQYRGRWREYRDSVRKWI
jgi:protein-S-isoprenylcysteine O-methyltransferase Ste14